MNNTEIVLKRLVDLKKLSNQLKEQTQRTSTVDPGLVKAILETTKDVSNKRNQTQSASRLYHQSSNQELPIFKMLVNSKSHQNPIESQRSNQENGFKPLFPETANFPKKTPSSRQNQLIESQEEEIINLKEENLVLEKQMKQLQEQLMTYKQKQQINNKKQYDMPFFKLVGEIQVFCTKIKIDERDYRKIEYQFAEVQLSLQTITINLRSRRELNINELHQVQYYSDNVMLLQFFDEESEEIQSLFIKFQNEEEQHNWDVGIYISFKIINSLEEENLFLQEMMKKKNQEKKQEENEDEQKKILKSYLTKKQEYIKAQKQLRQSMIEKIQDIKHKKQLSQSHISSQNLPQKQLFQVFKEEQVEEKNEQHEQVQQPTINFILDEKKEKTEEEIQEQEENKRKKEQEQQEDRKQQEQRQRQEKLKLQQEKIRLQQEQIQQERKEEEARKKQQELQKIKKENQLKNAIDRLKYGFMLIKYAKGAINPHEKRVFLSLDEQKLCWEDKDSNGKDVKTINIDDIVSINIGDIGEGIEKHVGPKKKIHNLNCYGIILMKTKDRKSLEFGGKSSEMFREFMTLLQIYTNQKH